MSNVSEIQTPVELLSGVQGAVSYSKRRWHTSLWQMARFAIVGVLNTTIDVVTLNILLWYFPTHNANLLLGYNSIAYTLGALNSFGLNKYWTFRQRQAITGGELLRFVVVNILGILCNDGLIWSIASSLHPLIANNLVWANISKASAIAGTAMVSYFGMRLWVFAKREPLSKDVLDSANGTGHILEKELIGSTIMTLNGIHSTHQTRSEVHESKS